MSESGQTPESPQRSGPDSAPATDPTTTQAPEAWPFNRPPALILDPIVQSLLFIVVVSALFLAWPELDLDFNALFYKDGEGFIVSDLEAFRIVRELNSDIIEIVLWAMLGVLVFKLVLPELRTLLPPRHMLFSFLALLAGPGILVNAVFKPFSGRPRPVHVEQFGGELTFVGVWDFSGACPSNCSFVSGEASSALWLVTLAIFLPAAWRARAVAAILALTVILSLNRIAYGGHFLSDVLLSWGMTLTVIAALHRWLYVHTPAALTNEALEAALTRAGFWLRAPFRRKRDDA